MDENNNEIKVLAVINILNGIKVSEEENWVRLVTAIRELREVATKLHNDANMQKDIQ